MASRNPQVRPGGTLIYSLRVTLDPTDVSHALLIAILEKAPRGGIPFATLARDLLLYSALGILDRLKVGKTAKALLLSELLTERLENGIGDALERITRDYMVTYVEDASLDT